MVGVVDEMVKEGRWGGGQVGEGRKVIRVMDEMVRRCRVTGSFFRSEL